MGDDDNRTPNFMYLTCFEKKIQCCLFELISFFSKNVNKKNYFLLRQNKNLFNIYA